MIEFFCSLTPMIQIIFGVLCVILISTILDKITIMIRGYPPVENDEIEIEHKPPTFTYTSTKKGDLK